MNNKMPYCNPCQSYHPVSQPCFDVATRPTAQPSTIAPGEGAKEALRRVICEVVHKHVSMTVPLSQRRQG
jgi:hypothetical protein